MSIKKDTSYREPEEIKLLGESKLQQQMIEKILQLPPEVYLALAKIEKYGSSEDLDELKYAVISTILSIQYDIAHCQVMAEMNEETINQLQTQEDITNLAISLTSN